MLPSFTPLRALLVGACVAGGGYLAAPPDALWNLGIHKPYPLESFWIQNEKGEVFKSDECYERPIVLITWASWCPWMPTHFADLHRLHDRFAASDLCFLSVATDEKPKPAWDLARGGQVPNAYWGYHGLPAMFWKVPTTPAIYIIDRKGFLAYRGPLDGQEYETLYPLIVDKIVDPDASAPQFTATEDAGLAEDAAVSDAAQRLFANGKLAAVEAMADGFRDTKEKTALETWKLQDLYNGLVLPKTAPEADELGRVADLEAWISSRPVSIVPRVALGLQWYRLAWTARGEGAGDEVSEADGRLFQERLRRAGAALADAEKLTTKDPVLYEIRIDIARGESLPMAEQRALYERARAVEPLDVEYDLKMAYSLQPMWGGSEEELADFAGKAADVRGAEGNAAYARILLKVLDTFDWDEEEERNPFSDGGFSYPRVRAGCEDLLRRHPGSIRFKSMYARFAADAGDRETLRKALAAMGTEYDKKAWGSRRRLIRAAHFSTTGDDGRGALAHLFARAAASGRKS